MKKTWIGFLTCVLMLIFSTSSIALASEKKLDTTEYPVVKDLKKLEKMASYEAEMPPGLKAVAKLGDINLPTKKIVQKAKTVKNPKDGSVVREEYVITIFAYASNETLDAKRNGDDITIQSEPDKTDTDWDNMNGVRTVAEAYAVWEGDDWVKVTKYRMRYDIYDSTYRVHNPEMRASCDTILQSTGEPYDDYVADDISSGGSWYSLYTPWCDEFTKLSGLLYQRGGTHMTVTTTIDPNYSDVIVAYCNYGGGAP